MHSCLQHSFPNLASGDWNIICDFDGTITPFDITDALLGEFAAPEWERIEEKWLAGKITARQCMERQVALIDASPERLDAFLDDVPLTPGFEEFSRFCAARGLRFLVVSDGLDYSIRKILARHKLGWVPVVANRLRMLPGGGYKLEFPFGAGGCPSGVCKCSVAGAGGNRVVLIGDGLSDCCLAKKAQFIMAKRGKELQKHCAVNNYPYRVYNDFFDIRAAFAGMPGARGADAGQAEALPFLLAKGAM